MTHNEYLRKVLELQTLDPNGLEIADMKKCGQDIEATLNREFPESDKTIRYAGSYAKGTMIRESYDLDLVCYFGNEDTTAGETLADIFANVKKALEKRYRVRPKTSALRVRSSDKDGLDTDFHIDVVPGRYTDPEHSDTFLHVASREKSRLKTNLDTHVTHIRYSGILDEIRLIKLWNVVTGLLLKTFVLELLTIKVLNQENAPWNLSGRLVYLWEYLREHADTFTVEDPANPSGNDLSEYLADQVRSRIKKVATRTLKILEDKEWDGIFGPLDDSGKGWHAAAVITAPKTIEAAARPWHREK